jgi:hypothetical protein
MQNGNGGVRSLPVASIRKDGQTQHRIETNSGLIAEYAELMLDGAVFPPLRVWWDGSDYWLSDGFQRLAAAESLGAPEIEAEVRHGSLLDAQWDSYSANAVHGARRTAAETRNIIQLALLHPNAKALTNVQIAKALHLPETTVRRWRNKLSSPRGEDSLRTVTRGGTTYQLSTAKLGKKRGVRQPGARRDLKAELAEMKSNGSPTARRLLNIVGNWVSGAATPADCLTAIERFVGYIGPPEGHPDKPCRLSTHTSPALAERGKPSSSLDNHCDKSTSGLHLGH